jgi:photosystem I subunit III
MAQQPIPKIKNNWMFCPIQLRIITMKRLFVVILAIALSLGVMAPALAAAPPLKPCKESKAFLDRQQTAPDGYYFTAPYKAYSEYLVCGEDGLPHLTLNRVDRVVDAAIPIALFLYVAGFIGWSGRAYLQAAQTAANPEQKEIFIDIAIAIQSLFKGLLWPLLFLQELVSKRLTANDLEIYVSPR